MKHKHSHQLKDVIIEKSDFETSKMEPFFKGRMGRNEFIWYYLMFVLISIVVQIYSAPDNWGLSVVVGLIIGIATASLIVQRLHDLGRPGYHYWIMMIPIYNIIFFLFELCGKKGQIGSNKYGVDSLEKIKERN